LRRLAIPLLALAAAWLARAAAGPTIAIQTDPPNPSAGQRVRLGAIPGAGPDWTWDFGDGASSSAAAPEHAWGEAGDYTVTLSSAGETTTASLSVAPAEVLRLDAAHPFEISVDALNPHDGHTYPSRAVAISDRFGWFSFPQVTGDPDNPEVTVKLLEAKLDGHYWIFWSAMTSLEYTMTVRDTVTGSTWQAGDPATKHARYSEGLPSNLDRIILLIMSTACLTYQRPTVYPRDPAATRRAHKP